MPDPEPTTRNRPLDAARLVALLTFVVVHPVVSMGLIGNGWSFPAAEVVALVVGLGVATAIKRFLDRRLSDRP